MPDGIDFDGVYQDILVDGELVHKGRECAERLNMILPHVPPNSTVLDIGSHSGYFAIELARRGHNVKSYEIEERLCWIQLWAANENGVEDRLHLVNAPFTYSVGHPGHYDVVLLLAVIQYYDDKEACLKAIREIGDKVIVEFPTPEETEAVYIDQIRATHPFDEYLGQFFSQVTLIGEPEAPYMNGVKRKMWLCEK